MKKKTMSMRKVSQDCPAPSLVGVELSSRHGQSIPLSSSLQRRPNLDEKCTNGVQRSAEDESSANKNKPFKKTQIARCV
jgi:hypothetical protein